MDKSLESLLRLLALVLIFLLLMGVALFRIRSLEKELDRYKNAPADTSSTKKIDTVYIDNPQLIAKYESDKEKVAIEVRKLKKQLAAALNMPADTLEIHDTTTQLVYLPREYMVYKDTSYRAVVSGVQPRLDSIEVYRTTITNTITKYVPQKPKTFVPFLEGGVSVNAKDNKEVMGEAGAGLLIKDKVGFVVDWQHNFQTKQNYVGGKVIIKLK